MTFRKRSGDFMNKRPVILAVKGKAAAIVQDAEAYQRLLDIAARDEKPNRCPVTPNHKVRPLLHGKKPQIYRAIYPAWCASAV